MVESGSGTAGRTVDYAYDAAYRLVEERIFDPATGERIIAYEYDAVGNRTLRTVASAGRFARTAYIYDENDRLLSETSSVSTAGAPVAGPGGRLVAPPSRQGVELATGAYLWISLAVLLLVLGDLAFRLAATRGRGEAGVALRQAAARGAALLVIVGLAFDARLVHALGVGEYPGEAPVAGDGFGSETLTYTWDANGNLLSRSDGIATDVYAYDGENRLVLADVALGPAPGRVEFAYDADGFRIGKTVNGVATRYLVDHNTEFARVLLEETAGASVRYDWGDDLLAQTRAGLGARYHLADGRGSTRQLADAAGAVTDTYDFDAFGVPLDATGTHPNEFLFSGEPLDPNVGFYQMRARWYAQAQGRFTTTDPESGSPFDPVSLHRYLYANADPVNNTAPSGRFTLAESAATYAIVGILAGLAVGGLFVAAEVGEDFSPFERFVLGFVIGFVIAVVALKLFFLFSAAAVASAEAKAHAIVE